jgi:hypothetical protein
MANTIKIPVPDVAYARVNLPEIDIGDNPYEALEGAAAGIAGALEEREARDDDAFLNEAEADWHETTANQRVNAARNGGTGPDQLLALNDTLEERYKYWEAKTTKPALRKRLRQRFARLRFNALPADIRDEADARAADAAETTAETMRNLAEVAYYRPEQIGDVRERLRELREEHPEQADELARQGQAVNEAYLRGLIETNPKLALETLRSRKGYAEEDLGISEPAREALVYEAERATELESDGESAAHDEARIGATLDTAAWLSAARVDPGIAYRVYEPVRDAYKVDPKTGARLEIEVDEAHAAALRRAERHNSVGRALVEGRALKWHPDQLESLDAHIEAVANDGSSEATANARRGRMAVITGRTPPKMQQRILKSLHAADTATRAGGLRLLQKLEEADRGGSLTAWLPADHRAFAHRFAALGTAGYADADALKHLDAAKSQSPALEEARRHHFDTYIRMDDLIDTAARTYNVEPEGIADDDMQTLDYRPGRDGTLGHTQEYRPSDEAVGWQEVVQRGPRGDIRAKHDATTLLWDDEKQQWYPLEWYTLWTDRGTEFSAKKYKSGDPYRKSNCFGFVLLDGEFWVEPKHAATILHDEYRRADTPQVGDIVLYFEVEGDRRTLVHAAKVVRVDGKNVRVIGKRGTTDADGVETDIDKQWPGEDLERKDPRYRGRVVRHRLYRRR